MFIDGVNAHRRGDDYQYTSEKRTFSSPLKVHMAPGGGFAIKLSK